eukprot:202140-Prymnesium_polylepis.1
MAPVRSSRFAPPVGVAAAAASAAAACAAATRWIRARSARGAALRAGGRTSEGGAGRRTAGRTSKRSQPDGHARVHSRTLRRGLNAVTGRRTLRRVHSQADKANAGGLETPRASP